MSENSQKNNQEVKMAKAVKEVEAVNIVITSICAGYKKEVDSYEKASEETGLSVDTIVEAVKSGDLVSGYRFKIVG